MLKSKNSLYISIIFFIFSIALNFPFPHSSPYGETVAAVLSIPVRSTNGIHYLGITALVLFFVSLFFLNRSLEKYHGRFTLLAIALVIFLPPFLANTYQKTIATGIYAISYEQEESNCTFELKNPTTLHGVCELTFENYSNENVPFTIAFYERYYFEDDIRMASLMNNSAPYQVEIRAGDHKRVIIETDIDVSEMTNYPEGGSASGVNIIIRSEDKYRKL